MHGSILASLAIVVALGSAPGARADVVVSILDKKVPQRGISLAADATTITLHSAEGPVVKLATTEVVEITTVPQPPAPAPGARPFEVELTDGSRLRGALDAAPEGSLRLRSPILRETVGHLDIPLEIVLAVRRVDGAPIPGSSRLVRIPGKDAAYTLGGARLEGFVAGFSATGVEVDRGDLGRRGIGFDQLAAVFIDNEEVARPEGLHVVARMADGSAAILTQAYRVAGGTLTGRTPSGAAIRVSLARVAAIGFQGGSFVHLSDLEPAKVDREPFFPILEGPAAGAMLDFVCPVRKDTSPDGRPITLLKRRYFKGIGVRPTTTLTYELGGKYRRFEAILGIDDEVLGPGYGRGAGTGSVVFRVLADGKPIYESAPAVGGREPQRAAVDIAGVQRLSLVVTLVPEEKMAEGRQDSPELDNAVWARPLLIR